MQSVMCLAADTCLTAYPGVASSIMAQSHTFMETDHEIISMAILLPSADLRRVVSYSSYKQKYVHEVVRRTDPLDMTIAVDWDIKNQTTKRTKQRWVLTFKI